MSDTRAAHASPRHMPTGTPRSLRGFSLVELMVALAIGLFIMLAVGRIFTSNRSTYQLDEGLARAQENGRFAMRFITTELLHAGNFGCRRGVSVFNFLNGQSPLFQPAYIRGFDYTASPTGLGDTYTQTATPATTLTGWTPAIGAVVPTPGALPGSDVIAMQRVISTPVGLISSDKSTLTVQKSSAVTMGQIMLISDCKQASIFQVTKVTSTATTLVLEHASGAPGVSPGNRCTVWRSLDIANSAGAECVEQTYGKEAEAGAIQTVVFFVRLNSAGVPSLYRGMYPIGGPLAADELVEGIENIQALYGVDSDGDLAPDTYVTAGNVLDWNKVMSVRIAVLARTLNAPGQVTTVTPDTTQYNVLGTLVNAPPGNLMRRRVFTTTVELRNRGS